MSMWNDSQEFTGRKRVEIRYKLLISLILVMVSWCSRGGGRCISEYTEVDRQMDYIFETTIAVERTRFRKRIIEQDGVWRVMAYMGQAKWVDLEVDLRTRIGFRPDNYNSAVDYDPESEKYTMTVYQPVVLDSSYTTRVVDQSNSFFSSWEASDFKSKEDELISRIIEEQSQLMLYEFKREPSKISDLVGRLENQLSVSRRGYFGLSWLTNFMSHGVLKQLSNINQLFKGRQSKTNQADSSSLPSSKDHRDAGAFDGQKFKEVNLSRSTGKRLSTRQEKMRDYIRSKSEL